MALHSLHFRIFLCLCNLAACGTHSTEQDNHLHWFTGAGPTRGHEDLTRMGVDRANAVLESQLGFSPYPAIAKGSAGIDSNNPFVRGNFEADFPSQKIFDYYKILASSDWHREPSVQHVHSLRDKKGDQYLPNLQACQTIRKAIGNATMEAGKAFALDQIKEGFYWLGHATHIIQDSFSPAHTQRNGENLRSISSICTYGDEFPGICYHRSPDLRDRIWKDTFTCSFDSSNRSFSCLVPEAKIAVMATSGYLRLVGLAFFGGEDLDQSLASFYFDSTFEDAGYFECENLQSID